jgi:hypothetical protein
MSEKAIEREKRCLIPLNARITGEPSTEFWKFRSSRVLHWAVESQLTSPIPGGSKCRSQNEKKLRIRFTNNSRPLRAGTDLISNFSVVKSFCPTSNRCTPGNNRLVTTGRLYDRKITEPRSPFLSYVRVGSRKKVTIQRMRMGV